MWGQQSVGGVVVEAVGDVGEEGAAGRKPFDERDGFFEGRVGWVGLAAQRVQDEKIEAGEQGNALRGKVAEVGQIGGRAEAEAGDGLAAVGDGDTQELHVEEDDLRAGGDGDAVQGDPRPGGIR